MTTKRSTIAVLAGLILAMLSTDPVTAAGASALQRHDEQVQALLGQMTLQEKIGQMTQVNGHGG